jgi:uncharacterized protein YbcC (UPF0753/DUF2309 family)
MSIHQEIASAQPDTVNLNQVSNHNPDTHEVDAPASDVITHAIERVCQYIAPTWPLDRMIAVNPYWERRHQSFDEVAQDLAVLAGSPVTMPTSYYHKKWIAGDIKREHLQAAITEKNVTLKPKDLIDQLDAPSTVLTPAPLFSDVLDSQRDLHSNPAWCDTITHQIAQFCAAFFDRDESSWFPEQKHPLYAAWRQALTQDHSVALLMKAPHIPALAKTLPDDPIKQIENTLHHLRIDAADWERFLQVVLLRLSGWAAWCAYLRWQANLQGTQDDTIIDLLAIRLGWEYLIDDNARHQGSIWSRWHESWRKHFQQTDQHPVHHLLLWQRAHELSFQQALAKKLSAPEATRAPTEDAPPAVQAAFCIDVRSEVFRRHLEEASNDIQTIGFAGFFGLPISYTPLGTQATRPQLPGLLAPTFEITDSCGTPSADEALSDCRAQKLAYLSDWQPFQSVPVSAFSLMETLGLGYLGKLIKRNLPRFGQSKSCDSLGMDAHAQTKLRPRLDATSAGGYEALSQIAQQVLTGMNLRDNFARLVLLVGHGSQTENNAQRAGLDCGACCGQTGDINARALADLLNNPSVRAHLKLKGTAIPPTTVFLAGLHNTTTDEVTLYNLEDVPDTHQEDLTQTLEHLTHASQAARIERAAQLGLSHLTDQPKKLTQVIRSLATDWAQTRPEWGLANNAAFIIAPRKHTRALSLEGRSFLHEYDPQKDPEGILLDQIMTAPMIVTHWINMQYFSSTVDNHRYGSGNKTLHNVVGGRLGLFEGNGGDLRIGLAKQSVHNGEHWCHDPLRLTVVIDAPAHLIEGIINKHEAVKALVNNQWLYLARFKKIDQQQDFSVEDAQSTLTAIEFYRQGQWQQCQ